jgi:hypothetical protein
VCNGNGGMNIAGGCARLAARHGTARGAGASGWALEDAQRTHARRMRALLYEDRLRVRVGQVELRSGTAVADRQAVEAT